MKIGSWASPIAPVQSVLNERPKVQDICDSLGPGVEPLPAILSPEQALELQAPALKRPVLLVHGLAQQADTWVNLKNFLCSHPENQFAGVVRSGQPLPSGYPGNVFIINLQDNLASPESNAAEVREALAQIRRVTGERRIDVVTHSMGAYQAREALRQGEESMANLIMIAPPSQGAFGANLLMGLSRVGYDHYPAGKTDALESLRLEKGPLGGVSNEFLHRLNQSWETDKERLQSATIITGVGLPTPDRTWKGTSQGDGMVAVQRAGLPDTPMYIAGDNGVQPGDPQFRDFQMFRYNHLQIVSEAEVFRKVGQILAQPLRPDTAPQSGDQLNLF